MTAKIDRYWNQYLDSIPHGEPRPGRYVEAFAFGFTPEDAREIAPLVLSGTKTATGSVLRSYEADRKRLPVPGDHWIVIVESDTPICIIETTHVQIIPFDEVSADYAWEGGEGDRSLAAWREIYWDYIAREYQRLGLEPSAKAPLVLERFRVVYRAPIRADVNLGRDA
jgi:uncharacterized protein YhfF